MLALILISFLAVFTLTALALLGVFPFSDDTSTPPPAPSTSTSPPSSSSSLTPPPPPADIHLRAVPLTSNTSASTSPTPLSGLTTLNLYFLDTTPATPPTAPPAPPTPIDTSSPGPNTHPAGLAAYNCISTSDQAVRSLCWGTVLLPEGQLSFQGAQPDRSDLSTPPAASDNHDVVLTITGGTDAYASVHGTLFVDTLPAPSSQQDWIFHFRR